MGLFTSATFVVTSFQDDRAVKLGEKVLLQHQDDFVERLLKNTLSCVAIKLVEGHSAVRGFDTCGTTHNRNTIKSVQNKLSMVSTLRKGVCRPCLND